MGEEISVSIESIIRNLNGDINRLSSSLTAQIQKLTETVGDLKSDVKGTLLQHKERIKTTSFELDKNRQVAHDALGLAEVNATAIENLSSKFREQKKQTDERKTFFSQTSSMIIGTVVAVFIVAVLTMMYESVAIERKMLDDHRSKVVQVQTPPNSSPDNQTIA